MSVEYILADHLGSSNITTNADGDKTSEVHYTPWGEVLSSWSASASLPMEYTFTEQASYMDDPITNETTEGFGLMFFNARWLDPAIGRFAQADSIVPPGVQGLDRYAYANNSPLNYIDTSGHFSRKAIWDYLLDYYDGDKVAATNAFTTWKSDNDWWDMITAAQPGNVLFGESTTTCTGCQGTPSTFTTTFTGSGSGDDATLTGISTTASDPFGISLNDIQSGSKNAKWKGMDFSFTFTWAFLGNQDMKNQAFMFDLAMICNQGRLQGQEVMCLKSGLISCSLVLGLGLQ
jgi:RHS repeat-associated protein